MASSSGKTLDTSVCLPISSGMIDCAGEQIIMEAGVKRQEAEGQFKKDSNSRLIGSC